MTTGWPIVLIVELMFIPMMFALHAEDQELHPKRKSGSPIPLVGVRNVKKNR